jgi:hypothetical protein
MTEELPLFASSAPTPPLLLCSACCHICSQSLAATTLPCHCPSWGKGCLDTLILKHQISTRADGQQSRATDFSALPSYSAWVTVDHRAPSSSGRAMTSRRFLEVPRLPPATPSPLVTVGPPRHRASSTTDFVVVDHPPWRAPFRPTATNQFPMDQASSPATPCLASRRWPVWAGPLP